MSLPKYPILLPSAVALNGDRTDIPLYGSGGSFSYNSGFPSITQSPLSAGGIPPSRADFNGIFHELSQHTFYQQSGGMYAWSEELDYPINALVYGSDNELYQAIQVSGISHEIGTKNPIENCDYWKRVSVSLSNAINSTSNTIAATSSAVKTAYDRGTTALTEAQKATSKAYVNATNNTSYIKFSNGIIMQWGTLTSNGLKTVTFSVAFASTSYSFFVWDTQSGGSSMSHSGIVKTSKTKNSIQISSAANAVSAYGDTYWFAIGK